MDEETQSIYQALKGEAARFNDTQAECEMVVGQPLEGQDAVNFLQWLMNAHKAVQGGANKRKASRTRNERMDCTRVTN